MIIVVLNDGETYTDLEGCKVAIVPPLLVPEVLHGAEGVIKQEIEAFKYIDIKDLLDFYLAVTPDSVAWKEVE